MDESRVLIVEDDRLIAKLHCRYIAAQPGFTLVGVAPTYEQALRFISSTTLDLVLLDLALPGQQSGLSVLKMIRGAAAPIETIVVSAHAETNIVRTCMQLGVLDYVVKPFWPQRLGMALEAYRARIEGLARGQTRLDQATIDSIRRGPENLQSGLPSGLRWERMEMIEQILAEAADTEGVTADHVAERTGISRVTARRYLEHLVARGQCTVDALPTGPGRPRKLYRVWSSEQIGALRVSDQHR